MKYDYSLVNGEISGFGGSYEAICRAMVVAGLDWCDSHPDSKLSFQQYDNIYGITTGESDDMKICQQIMVDASGGECTGAMLQATMNHLLFIRRNGWDRYVSEMNKRDEEDV